MSVIAGEGCSWTAASNASWLTVTSGATGSGRGTVALSLTANTGAARTGTVTIATQTFTVTQRAFTPACTYSISPTSQSVGPDRSAGTVSLTAGDGCSWTTVSSAAWVTVTQGNSGSGSGVIAFVVEANTLTARTATLTIANQVFTLTQAAANPSCTYAISPTSQTVSAAGGSVTVNVTALSGCGWVVIWNVPWITLTSVAVGSGNGSISFTVAVNTDASRSTTLTVAGQAFALTQNGAPASSSR